MPRSAANRAVLPRGKSPKKVSSSIRVMRFASSRMEHNASSPVMQGAYDGGMESERPYKGWRRERLKQLIASNGGPKALAALIESVDTHLVACAKGRRLIGDELATKLETVCETPVGWLDTDPSRDGLSDRAAEVGRLYDRLPPSEQARLRAILEALQIPAPMLADAPTSAPRLPI